MLLDRSQWKLHFPFGLMAFLLLAGGTVWYVTESNAAERWLGGGSTPGLVCGIVSGLIIFAEMFLWPRKMLRRWRLFPTKYWMAAHLWLGLVCFPLAILHCGFHLGGYLPATLMVVFAAAYLSGIYGWAIQNILPRWLLRNVPGETIYSQIDHVSGLAIDDIRRMLISSCGQRRPKNQEPVEVEEELDISVTQTIVIGAIRQVGKTSGRTLQTQRAADGRDDKDILWTAFDNIQPFLEQGGGVDSPVSNRRSAELYFQSIRRDCEPTSHGVVDLLEQACEQRRQFDVQANVHRWLHGWLPIHIGVSIATTILLLVHIWTALKYW